MGAFESMVDGYREGVAQGVKDERARVRGVLLDILDVAKHPIARETLWKVADVLGISLDGGER